jgi:hypothetical protein
MPIDTYKSRFNESLIKRAPLNKSALKTIKNYVNDKCKNKSKMHKITEIFVNIYNIKDKSDKYIRMRSPPNLFLIYSGIVEI